VDLEVGEVRLSIPAPEDGEKWKNVVVPNVMVIREDGVPTPVNYELRDDGGVDSPLQHPL
jgi:hypothetical protein